MRIFLFILFSLVVTGTQSLSGQCPDRDSLLKRISFLQNSATISKNDQLKELLEYDKRLKDCSYDNDSAYTILLTSIAISYFKLADYVPAIQYTRKALNIIHANANSPAISKRNLVKYYYYLSIFYDSLKLVSRKNEAIDSCISNELKENTNYHYTCLLLAKRVRDLFFKGDYNLCADHSTLGETLIHKFYRYSDSMDYVVYFIYYKAYSLYSLKQFSEATRFLESKKTEFAKMKNKNYVGVIYNLLGYLHETKGEYGNAIINFQKARRYDSVTVRNEISAEVLNQMGMIYSEKLNQDKLSLRYYLKALVYSRAADSVYILGNIANVYVRMKLFDSAYYFFQKAFDKIKQGINEGNLVSHIEDYVTVNTAGYVIKLVLDKGDACLKKYYYQKDIKMLGQALYTYKIADKLLNKIKSEQEEFQSRLFWRSYAQRLYEEAIETCYLQKNFNDAFYFFEKSRAILLNDQLNQQSKITNEDILKQAQVKRKIVLLERERDAAEISSNHYIEVQKELIVNKQALDRLGQAIKQSNPLYYQSFFDTSFVTLQDVRENLLKDHQALLELFAGDSAVYSLLVTPGHSYFNKISKIDFDSTAKEYIRYISNPALLNSRLPDYTRIAGHLYQMIFQNNPLPAGRIIISPASQYFPFEALVTSNPGRPLTYFIDDHAVSYTYSARYLLNGFAPDQSLSSHKFMGVAPVQYASSMNLPALTGSDQSLGRLQIYFSNANNLIASNASKSNFLRQFYQYKIIQLYTHATDSGYNGEPVIFFADSALLLSDLIYSARPATSLVILSACETGKGRLYQGEGVFSFNRGFASLGIPASVSNLWQVDNESTYRLTELFYKYLDKGIPVDVALQKAKIEFISTGSKEKRLPYYWAAPVLVGQSGAITSAKTFPWNYVLVIIGLTTISFWGWWKLTRKKH